MTDDERQGQEWKALYAELQTLLGKHGKEDPYGSGDFWIVDDNYGSSQHKVCVFEVSFVTRPLALEVQRVLRKLSLPWEVLFSFDKADARRDPNDLGISVHKANIEECWDVERMEKAFGAEFRWRPKLAAN